MAVLNLTPYKPVAGTVVDAGQMGNAFDAIVAAVNGIDNNNFATGKIFDPAKIMQSGATDGQALVWDTATSQWKPKGAMVLLYDSGHLGAAAPISITGIAATYSHLRLVIHKLRTNAAASQALFLRFNNDAGGNYNNMYVAGGSAAPAGSAGGGVNGISTAVCLPGTSDTPARWFAAVVDILDYADSTLVGKSVTGTFRGLGGASFAVGVLGGEWISAAAINRVDVLPGSGNPDVGSRVQLYGIS